MKRYCENHKIDYELTEREIEGRIFHIGCCPKCEEDFRLSEELDKISRDRESLERSLSKKNIEPLYYDSTFESFVVTNKEQERAKRILQKFSDSSTGKIIMIGGHGTGKTHLAVSAIRVNNGKIFSMYEISTRIRTTYVRKDGETELDVLNELSSIPMLAIDEIGRTKGSDAEINWLSHIIDKRHSRMLPLILISNKHIKSSCEIGGCDNCLENYMSSDMMSRISQDGILLTFHGDDYRKKIRELTIGSNNG